MYRETYSGGKLTYHHVILMAVPLAIKSAYFIIRLVMDKHFDGNGPDPKSAATTRAGGMRMAPGKGRGHLCWGPLIFKKNFLIPVLSDLLVFMTT